MQLSASAVLILAFLMLGVGGGFIYLIVRGGSSRRPQGALEWASAGLSALLVVCAGLLLLLALSVHFQADLGTRSGAKTGLDEPAENFAFRLVSSNEERQLATYEGNVVLINFWATWCAPCREEMPDLSRLQETYEGEGLVVLTLSDEQRQTLLDYEHEPPLKTVDGYVPNPKKLPDPFSEMRDGRPVSFVVDREGVVRRQFVGARSYSVFEEAIMPYL